MNNFWVIQPVYHYWDVCYWFYNKGIIQNELPQINKYYNSTDIITSTFDKCTEIQKKNYIDLIKNHYNKKVYNPTIKTMNAHMKKGTHPNFFSFYLKENTLKYKNKIFSEKEIIGGMLTRAVIVNIIKNETPLNVYYADFLCVHKEHRKKNIAAQIIQTHEYYQRHTNEKIAISLFKREGTIQGIIPICCYPNTFFDLKKWIIVPIFSQEKKIVKVDLQNVYYVYDKIVKTELFDILIYNSLETMIELIKENVYILYIIMEKEEIEAVYCFQRYENYINDKEIITCSSSILFDLTEEEFVEYFKKILLLICQENNNIQFLNIDNLSFNSILTNKLLLLYKPFIQSINAYFFYNYAYQIFINKKVFIFI
jgi:GNAT superfamily N-acetyltransferase